ncbi:hypothetical protein CMI48_00220 [Candidatus Pacearchaeota archaeon]|nr:hypothetical protein [Candidatus Pacearchaeota archaeon]
MAESIFQTKAWAEVKEAAGAKPVWIEGVLGFEQKLKLPFLGWKKVLAAEGTPKFRTAAEGKKVLEKFVSGVRERGYWYGTLASTVGDRDEVFVAAGLKKVSNHTVIMDLSRSEKELFSGLKRDIRRRLRKIDAVGIVIERSERAEDLKTFSRLYRETMQGGGVKVEEGEFFLGLRLLLKKRRASLWVARLRGKMIAGILVIEHPGYVVYNYGGSAAEGHEHQAAIGLVWQAILDAKRSGKKRFDLGGYDARARRGKVKAINLFKERFGGKVVEQPIWATNGRYVFLRKIMGWFGFLRGAYRKQ